MSCKYGQRWPARVLLLLVPLAALSQSNTAVPGSAIEPGATRFSAAQIAQGNAQFHRSCAPCHGRNMVNSGTTSFDLRKFPLDQRERFVNSVTQGRGAMPSFKEGLTPEQIALLWAYVGSRGGKEP